MMRTGTVSAVDPATCRARVRLPEMDNMRTGWLDVVQRNTRNNKDYWLPDVGEQVKVLLDEHGEDGVILGAVYSSADTPPVNNAEVRGVTHADGGAFYYDRQTHTLTINGGIEHIVIECAADVTVRTQKVTLDAPETEIRGNVSVVGNINATGSVIDAGGNSNHHSH